MSFRGVHLSTNGEIKYTQVNLSPPNLYEANSHHNLDVFHNGMVSNGSMGAFKSKNSNIKYVIYHFVNDPNENIINKNATLIEAIYDENIYGDAVVVGYVNGIMVNAEIQDIHDILYEYRKTLEFTNRYWITRKIKGFLLNFM